MSRRTTPDRHLDNAETNEAAWTAAKGAVIGAARWGLYGLLAGGVGYGFSPIYRALTIQFKVFIQTSFMTLGSMIEADRSLRQHEEMVRRRKRFEKEQEMWKSCK